MIETLPLFRPLNQKLIALLMGLPKNDWNKKTVAGNWTVKDVAAHLLDVNIRFISSNRDRWELKPDEKIYGYQDLVNYLNLLNADWVNAMKRVSSDLLVTWLTQTHEDYVLGLEKLDPEAPAKFSVAWSGEEISANWFHVAREFTEKWHHQQQIRDAVDQPGILTKEFYKPVLDTFFRALPHNYKNISAPEKTCIQLSIDSEAGGTWFLNREKGQWVLANNAIHEPMVKISLPVDLSWKLFTKAVKFGDVKKSIIIDGEVKFALPALQMVTVMA